MLLQVNGTYLDPITQAYALDLIHNGKTVYNTELSKMDEEGVIAIYAAGKTCCKKMQKDMLSDEEYSLLNKIAGLSGMACWFQLEASGDKFKVVDAEDGTKYTLREGIGMLCEGVTSLDDYACTEAEKYTFKTLCERMNVA
jgi:carboxypeptidase C (cathepsin A)